MTSRRKLRELVFSMMFQVEVGEHEPIPLLEKTIQDNEIPVNVRKFVRTLFRGAIQKKETLDEIVEEYAKGWRVSRIARIDITILRLAIYEMLYGLSGLEGDVPVVINEAILMAKKYSGPESSRFINGILGSIARDMDKPETRVGKMAVKHNADK